MSRTTVSGQTGRLLHGLSGNWECMMLGRAAALMGTKHYYDMGRKWEDEADRKAGREVMPWWFYYTQAYSLDGPACKEFAQALLNVTDEALDAMLPYMRTEYTKDELRKQLKDFGRYFARLKNGYKALS